MKNGEKAKKNFIPASLIFRQNKNGYTQLRN